MQALKLQRKYPNFSQEEMMALCSQFECVPLFHSPTPPRCPHLDSGPLRRRYEELRRAG